jgi:hypothetical protein
LLLGIALALGAYFAFYYASTARSRRMEQTQAPELAWLQEQFHLTDAEFARIRQMHEAYLEGCAQRCAQIDEVNRHLRMLLAGTNTVTAEIERMVSQAAALRAECQVKMLQHFYEVSRTMPPEQGRRYLEWIQQRTILTDAHSGMQSGGTVNEHSHH